jgi:hypothetical protein
MFRHHCCARPVDHRSSIAIALARFRTSANTRMSKSKVSATLQVWEEVRRKHRLPDAHVQMARELGMNPKKLGSLANHGQEAWKQPLPEFIETVYERRFGKRRPERVVSLEERAKKLATKKALRREHRAAKRASQGRRATRIVSGDTRPVQAAIPRWVKLLPRKSTSAKKQPRSWLLRRRISRVSSQSGRFCSSRPRQAMHGSSIQLTAWHGAWPGQARRCRRASLRPRQVLASTGTPPTRSGASGAHPTDQRAGSDRARAREL